METTIEKGNVYTYNQVELNKIINDTIDKIKKVVKYNNYQVNGELKYYNFDYSVLSKNQMKKIQKYCFWIQKKASLRRINTFLGLLARTYNIDRITVKVSKKEEQIQKARKEWLKVHEEQEKLLTKYKREKGDYYKFKLIF